MSQTVFDPDEMRATAQRIRSVGVAGLSQDIEALKGGWGHMAAGWSGDAQVAANAEFADWTAAAAYLVQTVDEAVTLMSEMADAYEETQTGAATTFAQLEIQ
ncbi:MAG: WXG100 family type VII secretion target [Bifidobacteriaceae bacterium]|jgi:WXG100 family type VII secretion target|nr:WXG100 family type VII secretion target [Bifidobacteriaceae bacterium]